MGSVSCSLDRMPLSRIGTSHGCAGTLRQRTHAAILQYCHRLLMADRTCGVRGVLAGDHWVHWTASLTVPAENSAAAHSIGQAVKLADAEGMGGGWKAMQITQRPPQSSMALEQRSSK